MEFKYILKSLKNKFDVQERYEQNGFDVHYEVGNTTSMDKAPNVPSPMGERIGSLAQRGGGFLEVLIENPTTFQIDREKMFSVINQLGVDISLHSNPGIGYTSTYRANYDATHTYFTKYLEQVASFKKDAENRAQQSSEFGFEISRINPHISVSPLPDLEEERAQGTGLDPFGYSIADLNKDVMDEKDSRGKNIYRNPEFLKRLYRTFIKEELGDREYGQYQELSSFSPRFDKAWRTAQNDVANTYFDNITRQNGATELESKAEVMVAGANDPAARKKWMGFLKKTKYEFDQGVDIPSNLAQILSQRRGLQINRIENLEDFEKFVRAALSQRYSVSDLQRISDLIYHLKNEELDDFRERMLKQSGEHIPIDNFQKPLWNQVQEPLKQAFEDLWFEEDDSDERKVSLIPVRAKMGGLAQQLEIPDNKIQEEAYRKHEEKLSKEVEKMFGKDKEMFVHSREDVEWEEQYERFLRLFVGKFEQLMWRESNSLYRVIPAWLSVSDKNFEGHNGWDGPKFLWDLLIKQKWGEERGYDIDLLNPRGKKRKDTGFLDLLENNQEFQADVAAASAGAYVWSHFTQRESNFELNDEILQNELMDDGRADDYGNFKASWIEWMNEFGIGVNLEAMPGSTEQPYKIWRPKHMVAACRAINITARKQLGDIHSDLDDRPAKFTIDLEHTATFGDDPWDTMEELIDQEERLAGSKIAEEYGLEIDRDKPLAKILRMWHLMKEGLETTNARTLHGGWDKGDVELYESLYKMVEAGFTRNPDEKGIVMYEVGGDDRGTVYMARLAMNMIELGISPEELDPAIVDPGKKYENEKQALVARFFGMDRPSYNREWAKIEQHAFDPLEGLLEAPEFDYTFSSMAAIKNDKMRQWPNEEYR